MGNDDGMVPGPLKPIDHIATVIAALERAASPGEMWAHRKQWAQRLRVAAGLIQPRAIPSRPFGDVRVVEPEGKTPIENPTPILTTAFTTRAVSMEALCALTIGTEEGLCARCGGHCPNRQL